MFGKASLAACMAFLAFAQADTDYGEDAARAFLAELNEEMARRTTESSLASWAYESNITEATLQQQLEVSGNLANFVKESWEKVIRYPWRSYKDPNTRRQFQKFSSLGLPALPQEKYDRLEKIVKDMQAVYGKAKICDYRNSSKCDLQLEPDITELMASSRDPEELKYLWTEWRKASGKPVRSMFVEYVELTNEAATLNNFTDASEDWLKDYEASDFLVQLESLWEQVKPLYMQLHAYVRRRLRESYGSEVVSKTGSIPAHLLGNVWGQSWSNILNDTIPYPNKPSIDVTAKMVEQKYTPLKMFEVAEEFFTSIGLSPMPALFWERSIIEKPNDGRDMICHASAWDFYDGKDFRIKQCTRVNKEDLETVHHEMGHIQYYLQYRNQPYVYKEGANPGFHEAVGDVMSLSVSTLKHLKQIGLLDEIVDDEESEINQLFAMALDKVAFLPFGYLMDQWRWGVFQGKINEKNYNEKWWELREKYQGLEPPTVRTENDFDPGAKYHIIASVPYIRYFVSFIIQFQFHKSLCTIAGQFDPRKPDLQPLHKCDIYRNKEAGEMLGNMLKLGSSVPWQDAMEIITGERQMNAEALLQYFSSLQTWLERENARTGEYVGWEPSTSKEYPSFGLPEEDREIPVSLADSFEDEKLLLSYAELAPIGYPFLDVSDYSEKAERPLRTVFRRSTENEFEIIEPVPGTKPAVASHREQIVKDRRDKESSPGRESESLGKGLFVGKVDPEVFRRNSDKTEAPRWLPRKDPKTEGDEVNPWLGVRADDKSGKQEGKEISALTKLLTSLGSTMAKHHPYPSNENARTGSGKMRDDARTDIMWNAELVKIEAQKMLKSFERNKDQTEVADRSYSEVRTADTFTDSKLSDPSLRMWKPLFGTSTARTLFFITNPSYGARVPVRRRAVVKARRARLPQQQQQHVPAKRKRSIVKKSFCQYHYNIRTPVYYNSIVFKKRRPNM